MNDYRISVKKLTDETLMREACECTFSGKSNQSLLSIYKSEHSPARTQMFWIKLTSIPLYVATHLIRHHVGSTPFQLTCRDDRNGGNVDFKGKLTHILNKVGEIYDRFSKGAQYTGPDAEAYEEIVSMVNWLKDNADRETKVNLGLCVNAQSLIDMAKLRLCNQASYMTRFYFNRIKKVIEQVDPDLAKMMVPKCVYRNGLCGEPICCGYNHTVNFQKELSEYLSNFTNKQKGITNNEDKSIEA